MGNWDLLTWSNILYHNHLVQVLLQSLQLSTLLNEEILRFSGGFPAKWGIGDRRALLDFEYASLVSYFGPGELEPFGFNSLEKNLFSGNLPAKEKAGECGNVTSVGVWKSPGPGETVWESYFSNLNRCAFVNETAGEDEIVTFGLYAYMGPGESPVCQLLIAVHTFKFEFFFCSPKCCKICRL